MVEPKNVREAEDFARAHPTKTVGSGGPSWNGWCAALMYWVGGFSESADTATLARARSLVRNRPSSEAPLGSFHWWDLPGSLEGHVGLDLSGGGTRVLMASRHVTESWGDALGVTSTAAYEASTSASYKGWSLDYIGQRMADTAGRSDTPGASSADLFNGHAGEALQLLARANGYQGPIDGVPGPNTWRGVQTLLRNYGYEGPLDGVPGINTFRALQRLASTAGYGGPIDGVPGPNTAAAIERLAGL